MYLIVENKKYEKSYGECITIPRSYSMVITSLDVITYEDENGDEAYYTFIPLQLACMGTPKTYANSRIETNICCNFGEANITDYFGYNGSTISYITNSDYLIKIYAIIEAELYVAALDIRFICDKYNKLSYTRKVHPEEITKQVTSLLLEGKIKAENVEI